jgi:hypothetical protein
MAIAMYLSLYFLGGSATILPIVNEGNRLGIASPIHAVFQHLRAAGSRCTTPTGSTPTATVTRSSWRSSWTTNCKSKIGSSATNFWFDSTNRCELCNNVFDEMLGGRSKSCTTTAGSSTSTGTCINSASVSRTHRIRCIEPRQSSGGRTASACCVLPAFFAHSLDFPTWHSPT